MASEAEIIKVLFEVANPQVFAQIQALRGNNINTTVNIKANLGKGLERILAINDHTINITANTTNLMSSLRQVEQALRNVQNLSNINITGSNPAIQLRNDLRQQARAYRQQGITGGYTGSLQNQNQQQLEQVLGEQRISSAQNILQQYQNIARFQQRQATPRYGLNSLRDTETQRQLAFAFLGGGIPGLIGGTAGAIKGGPGGVILGTATATAAVGLGTAAFEALTGALKSAAEAGFIFQRSVLGISSVLFSTTKVIGPSGKELPISEQLSFQGKRARDIQLLARQKLLPLGIGGETEASIVQAVVTGSAGRGLNLSAKGTATVSERLGAFAQVLGLTGNSTLIQRDIRDILSGSPQGRRTALGSNLVGIAPELFSGKIRNEQGLLQATEKLSNVVTALRENSDSAAVSILKLSGNFEQIKTSIGDAFLQGLKPGLDSLNKQLADPKLQQNLISLATSFGDLTSNLIKNTSDLINAANNFKTPGIVRNIGAVVSSPLGTTVNNLVSSTIGGNLFSILGRAGGAVSSLFNNKSIANKPETLANQIEINKTNATIVSRNQFAADLGQLGLAETFTKYQTELQELPNILIDKLTEITKTLSPDKTKIEEFTFVQEQIIDQRKKVADLKLKTFDTTTIPGSEAKLQFQAKETEADIANRKSIIARLQEGIKLAATPGEKAQRSAQLTQQESELGASLAERSSLEKQLTQQEQERFQIFRESRDLSEQYDDTVKDSILTFHDLQDAIKNNQFSFQEATDSLKTFSDNAKAAIFGKENQLVSAAQEIEKLGGENLIPNDIKRIIGDPEELRKFQLRGAITQFNALSGETGRSGIFGGPVQTPLVDRNTNAPFQNSLRREQEQLRMSIGASVRAIIRSNTELDKFPRALRSLVERIFDFTRTQVPKLGDSKLPKDIKGSIDYLLGIPGGISPASINSTQVKFDQKAIKKDEGGFTLNGQTFSNEDYAKKQGFFKNGEKIEEQTPSGSFNINGRRYTNKDFSVEGENPDITPPVIPDKINENIANIPKSIQATQQGINSQISSQLTTLAQSPGFQEGSGTEQSLAKILVALNQIAANGSYTNQFRAQYEALNQALNSQLFGGSIG